MRIAFLCKRRYMSKDVILDRYARLYEIPFQLARLGHEVRGYCLSYGPVRAGEWEHEAAPGSLHWRAQSLGAFKLTRMLAYPFSLLRELRRFGPDVVIGASDIPHVAMGSWLAGRLGVPYMADLYDNFEGFGQAKIPGFVTVLRRAVRKADLVTTTSEPLRQLVLAEYRAKGEVIAMPSSVDLAVFAAGDKRKAREALGLPLDARLIGTAGGLYRDKGVEPLYAAWERIREEHPDVRLVLAGPVEKDCPPPAEDRVHHLGMLPHARVADLFRALDVGVISILDTPFGRYCFPQKAYEMLACGLPVVAADVGAMSTLFAEIPRALFTPENADSLSVAVTRQLRNAERPAIPISGWDVLVGEVEEKLRGFVGV